MTLIRASGALRAVPILFALSCSGQIGDIGAGPGGTGPGSGSTGAGTTGGGTTGGTTTGGHPVDPGFKGPVVANPSATSRFIRMNHEQWENTVRDVLRLAAPLGLSNAFVAEPLRGTFDTNATFLTVDADLWQDYQTASETAAHKVAADAKLLAQVFPTVAAGMNQVNSFIQTMGQRVYRRPLTTDEVTRYATLFAKGPTLVGSANANADGVELVLGAMFQSPFFLYRAELSSTVASGKIPLNDFEVATKLSYALTNTMPDDALFTAAAGKQLESRDGVLTQATRLLGTAAAESTVADFHDQLLRMRDFDAVKKDATASPLFPQGVGADLTLEGLNFVKNVVIDQDRGFTDLFSAPFTFANSRIKRIYGMTATTPPAGQPDPFVRIDLDATQRAGLLTQTGFLSANAEGVTPNIIIRGVHIAKDILCVEIPPPPNNIPPIPALAPNSTNRQRIETLTMDAPCNTCHPPFINPLGFALEKLSGIGSWRTTENGQMINAKADYTLDGKPVSFDGPVELAKAITSSDQAHACYAKHWAEYLYGRDIDAAVADADLVTQGGALSKNVPSAKNLILNLVSTDAFLARLP
jgi:hypothetical protein